MQLCCKCFGDTNVQFFYVDAADQNFKQRESEQTDEKSVEGMMCIITAEGGTWWYEARKKCGGMTEARLTSISHTHQTQTRLSAQPICHNMNDEHTLTHTYHPLPQKVFRNTDMHYPICHSRSISVLRSLCIFHLFLISFPAYLVLIPGLHAGIRLTLRTALSWLDNQVLILYVKWAHQHAFNS